MLLWIWELVYWTTDNNSLCSNKNNMEHLNEIERTRNKNVLMIVAAYLAIILLLVSIIVIVKNIEEIRSDGISYGMRKNDFTLCTCSRDNNIYYFNQSGYIPQIQNNILSLNSE
jgi:predicted nucleic acid-binding Zn ribbon protein